MRPVLLVVLIATGVAGCDYSITACTEASDPACRPSDDGVPTPPDGSSAGAAEDGAGDNPTDGGSGSGLTPGESGGAAPDTGGGNDASNGMEGDSCGVPSDGSGPCSTGYRCDQGRCTWGLRAPPQDPADCGQRLYVDSDSTAEHPDGRDWLGALPTLWEALHIALARRVNCDAPTEIWVAEGRYTPTADGDRNARFLLHEKLELYGGFVGNEDAREARDPAVHSTVLSGDLDGDDNVGRRADNSRHILVGTRKDAWLEFEPDPEIRSFWEDFPHADRTTVVDGFTVSGGYAEYSQGAYNSAPAMRLHGRSITARHLVVTDNHAHEGSCAISAGLSLVMEDVRISNNGAIRGDVSGPLVFSGDEDTEALAVLRNTVIVDNAGDDAVSFDMRLRVSIEDSYIGGAVDPHAAELHALRTVFAGAIESTSRSTIRLVDSVITPNEPGREGGLTVSDHSDVSLDNCILAGGRNAIRASGWSTVQLNHLTASTVALSDVGVRYVSLSENSSATVRNSVVHGHEGPDLYGDSTLAVESSCVPQPLPQSMHDEHGPCTEGPMFRGPLADGQWTIVAYDRGSARTSFSDSTLALVPGSLRGLFVQADTEDSRWLHVLENTETDVVVWGDQTSFVSAGDSYRLHDLRLHADSVAVDAADDSTALTSDMLGQSRVDLADRGKAGTQADQGALELTEAVRDSCQVDCE